MTPGARTAATALGLLLAVVSWHSAWELGRAWELGSTWELGRASGVGGPVAALGYGVAIVAALRVGGPRVAERLPSRVLPVLVTGVVVAPVIAFVLGVPTAYADALGVGSDRADALGVALSRLAEGRYPYAATTYLGNPITPLPGALLLAAPFWALTGDAAWQNPAWLVLLLAVVHGRGPLRARPTVLWVLVGVGGLEVLREFLVGDDLVTGTVPAVAALAWTLRVADRSPVTLAVAGLVLGVTTCTRPHLLLVLVVAVAAVGVRAGRRRAVLVGGGAGLAWAALIVPFLVGGIARFSPLHVAAKITGDRAPTPGLVVIALLAAAVLVAVLAVLRPSSPAQVGWCCAAVLAVPSVLSLVRGVVVGPATDIDLTLGSVAIPFAAWALARRLDQAPTTTEHVVPEAIGPR